jgi:hypothetical protein
VACIHQRWPCQQGDRAGKDTTRSKPLAERAEQLALLAGREKILNIIRANKITGTKVYRDLAEGIQDQTPTNPWR